MIVLHTFGGASIQIGSRKLLPTAARAFGALLYISAEPGRQIPRAELQSLLYPGKDHADATHNLRQLLYKLRHFGVPIVARREAVALAARHVRADYTALLAPQTVTDEVLAAATGGFLSGYAPDFSAPFAHWVEEFKTRMGNAFCGTLMARLTSLRSEGRWRELEAVARACLGYDPLNEDATVALAQSLVVNGQRAGAARLLDEYLGELDSPRDATHGPARVLRSRIAEQMQDTPYRPLSAGRFVGRDGEMAELWVHYQRAKGGDPRAVIVHGEPGLGKTRLVAEFARAAALDGATCVKVQCTRYDTRRPMAVFVDVVPDLLESPGALGASPETIDALRKLTTRERDTGEPTLGAIEPRTVSAAIVRALCDLCDAVASENPVVLCIDDGHFADPCSLDMVRSLLSPSTTRELLIVATSHAKLFTGPGEGHAHRVAMLRVQPLAEGPSRALAEDALRAAGYSPTVDDVGRCVEHAAGNPLYIRAAAADLAAGRVDGRVPRSLTELLRERIDQLDPRSLRVFAACAVLSRRATVGRLAAVVDLSMDDLFGALHDLHERGILDANPTALRSTNPLLSEIALESVKAGVLPLLHHRCAEQLEREAAGMSDAAMLWDCARHWEQAQNAPKALALLRSCAAHCVQIGQPQTACELLEHAERIAPPELVEEVLREAIAASQAAERFANVRALIGRYRARRPSATVHDEYELVEVDASRWEGVPLSDRRDQLWRCLSSTDAAPAHRLRAAGLCIVYADGWFDSAAAESAYRIAEQLRGSEVDATAAWDNVDVVYRMRFGPKEGTSPAARRAFERAQQDSSATRTVLLASNAAVAFHVAGSLEGAIEAGTLGFQVARRNGMRTSAVLCAAIMAAAYWDFDDRDRAMHWDKVADECLPDVTVLNRALVHVSNKIEFALAAGDAAEARSWLQLAGSGCAELQSPHNSSIGRGYELLIGHLEGREPPTPHDVDDLLAWHARARNSLSHDPFVEGLWRALVAAGQRMTAEDLLRQYIVVHRREQYPLRTGLRGLVTH